MEGQILWYILALFAALGVPGAIALAGLLRARRRAGEEEQKRNQLPANPPPPPESPRLPPPTPHAPPAAPQRNELHEQIIEIGQSDPILAEILGRLVGRRDVRPEDLKRDSDLVQQIARMVDKNTLLLLRIGATQKDLDFTDERLEEVSAVPYPTQYMEPGQMCGLEELHTVLPEQLMMETDEFFEALCRDELLALHSTERLVSEPVLHLVLDVSPSMDEKMPNASIPKHIWARGVAVSLLLKAIRGHAVFMLRCFDQAPRELYRASNREEAIELILYLVRGGFGGSGTRILEALRAAVKDILTDTGKFARSHVMLITDGEDDEIKSSIKLRNIMGEIRLHAAMIAAGSDHIKGAATTYRVF